MSARGSQIQVSGNRANNELLGYNHSASRSSSRNASVPNISVAAPKSDRSAKSSPKQKTPTVKQLYSDRSSQKSQKSKQRNSRENAGSQLSKRSATKKDLLHQKIPPKVPIRRNISSATNSPGQIKRQKTSQSVKSNVDRNEKKSNMDRSENKRQDGLSTDSPMKKTEKSVKSRIMMLPFGVVEDLKEDNKEGSTGEGKKSKKLSAREIYDEQIEEKNSYFHHSSEGDRSDKDVFNSSLGCWDINDEDTLRKKKYKSKSKPKLVNQGSFRSNDPFKSNNLLAKGTQNSFYKQDQDPREQKINQQKAVERLSQSKSQNMYQGQQQQPIIRQNVKQNLNYFVDGQPTQLIQPSPHHDVRRAKDYNLYQQEENAEQLKLLAAQQMHKNGGLHSEQDLKSLQDHANQFYASSGSRGAIQKMKLPQLSEAQLKNLYNQIMPQMQSNMLKKQQERRQSIQRSSDLRQEYGRNSVIEQSQQSIDIADSIYRQINQYQAAPKQQEVFKGNTLRKRSPQLLDLSIHNQAPGANEQSSPHLMFEGKKFQAVSPHKKKHRTGRAAIAYRSGSVPPIQPSHQQKSPMQQNSINSAGNLPPVKGQTEEIINGQKDSKLAMMKLAVIDQSSPDKTPQTSPKEVPTPWDKNSGEPLYLTNDIITNDALPLHLALDTNISPTHLNSIPHRGREVPNFSQSGHSRLLIPPTDSPTEQQKLDAPLENFEFVRKNHNPKQLIDNSAKYRPASKLNNQASPGQYAHINPLHNFQPLQNDLNLGEIKLTQQQALLLLQQAFPQGQKIIMNKQLKQSQAAIQKQLKQHQMAMANSSFEQPAQDGDTQQEEEEKVEPFNLSMQKRKRRFRKPRGSKYQHLGNSPEQPPSPNERENDKFEIAQTQLRMPEDETDQKVKRVEISELPELTSKKSAKKVPRQGYSVDMQDVANRSELSPMLILNPPSLAVTSASGTSALYCANNSPHQQNSRTQTYYDIKKKKNGKGSMHADDVQNTSAMPAINQYNQQSFRPTLPEKKRPLRLMPVAPKEMKLRKIKFDELEYIGEPKQRDVPGILASHKAKEMVFSPIRQAKEKLGRSEADPKTNSPFKIRQEQGSRTVLPELVMSPKAKAT